MGANQTIVNFLDTVALVMVRVFGANWRTTITGIIEGAVMAIIPFIGLPNFSWKTHAPFIAVGILKAIFGTYTKDKSVTGGVNENTVTKSDITPTKQP